jgi:hypothetical protein
LRIAKPFQQFCYGVKPWLNASAFKCFDDFHNFVR